MVTYNPKDWVKLIIHFPKSDTFRILLPAIFLLGTITAGVSFLEQKYFKDALPSNLTVFHQISGFIISLVLVFRINSAYDRWWEGRKLWGSLLNNSRNLALKLNAFVAQDDAETRKKFQQLISNYAMSTKEHLRGNSGSDILEYSANFKKENYLAANHRPNYIASLLIASAHEHCKKKPERLSYHKHKH